MQKQHSPQEIDQINLMLSEILKQTYVDPESRPVLRPQCKHEMIDAFFEPEPPKQGVGLVQTVAMFRDQILNASVRTWHPMFMNQMAGGASFPAIVGDLLASMMNPSMATWEVSPVATIIERSVASWMASILGMTPGSGGIFLPGGSISNLVALTLARNTRLGPTIARQGLAGYNRQPAVLCSQASHYSVCNAANLLGIGTEYVIAVKTNRRNEILIDAFREGLELCDERGFLPFAAVATMGSTVTGCFDPLEEMVQICRERNIHLHVDAAFGGGISLTSQGRQVLEGIDQADSVVWDAHKWLHVPISCTALLVRDPQVLKQVFSSGADYLYHPQGENVDLADDLGHYTLLCSKRFDALKLWILFKAYGEHYFREMAEQRMVITHEVAALIENTQGFELSYQPRSPLICFRYMPDALKAADGSVIDEVQRSLREQCKTRGSAFLNIATLNGRRHLRMVLVNPLSTTVHIADLLEELRQIATTTFDDLASFCSSTTDKIN